jgi:hypothetical protein
MPLSGAKQWKQFLNQLQTIAGVYYHFSTSHKDSKEDNKKSGVEYWRRLISNPEIKFSDSVNADETTLTTATITTDKLCSLLKSGNGEQSSGTMKRQMRNP